jgi:two-component system nitrogen regulation response regulator GlnG
MKKVLIVDDDDSIRWIIERKITKDRYKVIACASYEEALRAARKNAPDLILSDYNLSQKEDGIDLAQAILKRTKKEIPVIIMSGHQECREEAKASRFEYLPKPFDLNKLMLLIRDSLERQPKTDRRSKHRSINNMLAGAGRHLTS